MKKDTLEMDKMIRALADGDSAKKEALEELDAYCLGLIYDEYLELKAVNPNTRFDTYHLESKSFIFHFKVTVNTLPYVVGD